MFFTHLVAAWLRAFAAADFLIAACSQVKPEMFWFILLTDTAMHVR